MPRPDKNFCPGGSTESGVRATSVVMATRATPMSVSDCSPSCHPTPHGLVPLAIAHTSLRRITTAPFSLSVLYFHCIGILFKMIIKKCHISHKVISGWTGYYLLH